MESIRQKQVAELIKRNISLVLQTEGRYIYGAEALVTVTTVKMSPDMSLAKVYLSVYNILNKQDVILHLDEEVTQVRSSLAKRIRKQVRKIPELAFYMDDTLDEMYRIDQLFQKLEDDGQMGNGEEEE
jgi:ribosome-binding factor A